MTLDLKIQEFFEYRKEIKKPFKGEKSKEYFLKRLTKLSSGIESVAIEILEQSMANQWQGIFELPAAKKDFNTHIQKVMDAREETFKEWDKQQENKQIT